MELTRIETPTLRELFVQQLVGKIISGELKAGDKLPSEREMSEKLRISRSMVHLGLEELERMGFVRIEPRRGIYVTDYTREGNFDTLAALARYGGTLDDGLRNSVVELRNAVYGGGLIRLASSHTPEDIEALREQAERLRRLAEENAGARDCAREMRRFEILVTELSGNMLFPLLMNSFGSAYQELWQVCVSFWGADEVVRQEERIIELITDGKGHDAAAYVEDIYHNYCHRANSAAAGAERFGFNA